MAGRFYDAEFSPGVLQLLKKREVLGQSNPAQFVPLIYNIATEVETIEERFDAERKENPLLETTPPEAWLAAEVMPAITAIRPYVEIQENLLVNAVQGYFQRAVRLVASEGPSEQQLYTTVRSYRAALKKLLIDLYDRRKSLSGILRIRVGVRTIREALATRKPSSRRQAIILKGTNEHRSNQYIAKELDKSGLKPRRYKSYTDMLRTNSQMFYALKSDIGRKYRPVALSS